jgi:hypothetical protein
MKAIFHHRNPPDFGNEMQKPGNPGGRIKKRRPRIKWMDEAESDLRNLGVQGWRTGPEEYGCKKMENRASGKWG